MFRRHNLRLTTSIGIVALATALLGGSIADAANGCYRVKARHVSSGQIQYYPLKSVGRANAAQLAQIIAFLKSTDDIDMLEIRDECTGQVVNPYSKFGDSVHEAARKALAEIKSAEKRARIFRDWAIKNIGKLTERQFNIVNGQIDKYNRMLVAAQKRFRGQFQNFRTISRVPRSVIQSQVKHIVWYTAPRSSARRGNWEYKTAQQAQRVVNNLRSRYGRYGYRFGYYAVRR